jgi:hypothetical protein
LAKTPPCPTKVKASRNPLANATSAAVRSGIS